MEDIKCEMEDVKKGKCGFSYFQISSPETDRMPSMTTLFSLSLI